MVKEMSRMDFLDIIYLCSRKIALSENEKEKNNLLIIRDLIEEYRLKTK